MTTGILYICTGKYKIFWKDFYISCEKNFIPEGEKHYFVFTDSPEIEYEKENKNITRIYQENLGWPNNTLKRYEIFLNSKDKIEKTDYLFFFNANLLFLEKITAEEFLPSNNKKIVACLHPGFYNKPVHKYTFEKNSISKAFLNKKEGSYYFAGGINGGITKDFIKIIKILADNINIDLQNKILAVWHDESHWNWYLNNNLDVVRILSPSYLYPEGVSLPFQAKILIRDKNIIGGHANFRNKIELRLIINKLKDFIKKIISEYKPTKIITIKGGLGNQMFQYAYGRALEMSGEKVIFNTAFFCGSKAKKDTTRDFKLNNFNIETKAEFSNKKHLIFNIFNKVVVKLGLKKNFYQNEKYFKNIENNIRKEFTLKNPLTPKGLDWEEKISSTANSISLHIRRGDYVLNIKTNSFHGVCDIKYYTSALEEIVKKTGNNINIFIFSDDITWAKENLKFPFPFNFVSDSEIPDYEELYLMSLCKHNIIANSTFSWWGAWLNQNPDKIVIAPKQWLTNKTSTELDILPKEWIQI
jgi:hypothetical protein